MTFLLLAALALDPCGLLDPKTIAAVQGTAPRETKASEHPDGPFTSRQCFFSLPDFVRSISLEVTAPNPGAPKDALRERWDRLSGKESAREAEERERPSKEKIDRRGEEDE